MQYVAENDTLKVSVLYVEDDRQTLEKVSEMLKRRVAPLYVAADGREGLELFKRHTPDMVITDIRMPVMDGLEMATRIKAINNDVPIILTTAHNDEEYLIKSIDIGIDKYIKKPLDCNVLMDTLRKTAQYVRHQKEMEARDEFIRNILENSQGFVMITDCEKIRYLNSAFLNYLGCGSVEEFNASHGNIDKFLMEKKGAFYSGKQFNQWISHVIRNPRKEFIVYMSGRDRSKNCAGTYLVRADLTLHFGLDVGEAALEPADPQARRAHGTGQALGAEHHQRHQPDQQQFGKTDIEHRGAPVSVFFRRIVDLACLGIDGLPWFFLYAGLFLVSAHRFAEALDRIA